MFNKITRLFNGKTNNLLIQLFRYTIVGGLAFMVDYGLMVALTELLGWNYLVSATVSFVVGLVVNYILSTIWVFKTHSISNKGVEFMVYGLIGVAGLGVNDLMMYVLTDLCGIVYMLSKPMTAVVVYLWNFFMRKFLLFYKAKA